LRDGTGNLITSTDAILAAVAGACGSALAPATPSGGSALRYDATAQQFVFNWKTSGTGCTTTGVMLQDTTTQTINVTLR